MTGKILGVIDMRFGLRRILDKDPIENLRADQLLLCPSLLERLPVRTALNRLSTKPCAENFAL
jgi:hypothetical protein